jgi:hypothetical protein
LGNLEGLVSDWELEEIRQELKGGDAPDVVAFRHGVPLGSVRGYSGRHIRHVRRPNELWTDAENAFVKDNYPNHGKRWGGWSLLDRTWEAIRRRASILGVKRNGE